MGERGKRLGVVVGGSLKEGVEVKLDGSVEDIAEGQYVVIEGEKKRFFGLVTDIRLENIDPRVQPPKDSSDTLTRVLSGTITYGTAIVQPYLTLDIYGLEGEPKPAKTIPSHFSTVREARQEDVEIVFGKEDRARFYIGNPLDMEEKICLNLEEFVKRSNGVFGKSGTGKTFLTRLLLIGILQKGLAVNLVFDMHDEYGWAGKSEEGFLVKGLKQLFPSKIAVFSLDEEKSRYRGGVVDYVLRIEYEEIEPEDIALLKETLGLTDAGVDACYRLARYLGRNWITRFLELNGEGVDSLAKELNEHKGTLSHLRRKLENLKGFGFLSARGEENWLKRLLDYLESGISVILEFGRYRNPAHYILVANLITRRLYEIYRERVELAMAGKGSEPPQLLITIEEAHKFLSPQLSNQTIFGTIAREMRKYNATLLIVDQRPSGIDPEVMSQLGTKICCKLDNEKDIDSVLEGASGRAELKSVLRRLESKQQALIWGHSLPMPVVIRVREYGRDYSWITPQREEVRRRVKRDIEELWN